MMAKDSETAELNVIKLLSPSDDTGLSVFSALQKRKTTREISEKPLSLQQISNVLWAGCGVNRKEGPFGTVGVTAASASNSQEVELYVAFKDGVYLYESRKNQLSPVFAGDLRELALTPHQSGVNARAPMQIIYVADIHRQTHTEGFQEPSLHDVEGQKAYYFVDTGIIAGNIYLYAASQGLAAWFHNCDKVNLAKKLGLRQEQRVLFAHSVGFPKT
jgi:nitroreductase